jgi:hypothetical protein
LFTSTTYPDAEDHFGFSAFFARRTNAVIHQQTGGGLTNHLWRRIMTVRMTELTWTDYDRKVREDNRVVFVAAGSREQHGPHLPMCCDCMA